MEYPNRQNMLSGNGRVIVIVNEVEGKLAYLTIFVAGKKVHIALNNNDGELDDLIGMLNTVQEEMRQEKNV